MSTERYILTLQCPDTVGIVAAVATFLADRGLSIEESDQFHDSGAFYMRTAFSTPRKGHASLHELDAGFAPIGRRYQMVWEIADAGAKPRIVIAASKQSHCLIDLVHRCETRWLGAEIAAVFSNHADHADFVGFHKLDYRFMEVTPQNKAASEQALLDLVDETGAELLVLARYMQILSPETCAALAGRCINIHHSFLPSFKGANPYQQAHARGVKIIGATAHYVTPDLDEGPIIEQAVGRISHHHTPNDLIEMGRDLECAVLARAVRWHVQRRVVINGVKTVVFA
jgi:formyltetrahydrofolate deformylase